jgi:hypothetical protein
MDKFTVGDFFLRLLGAVILVFCSFNPIGYSYYHWVAGSITHPTPLQAISGIVLIIAWSVFLTATTRSIGLLGAILTFALCAAVIWLLVSWGWVNPNSSQTLIWLGLGATAIVLATGLSWSHIRRQLSGQADVDEIDQK